jgi:hypothetical protein
MNPRSKPATKLVTQGACVGRAHDSAVGEKRAQPQINRQENCCIGSEYQYIHLRKFVATPSLTRVVEAVIVTSNPMGRSD